MLRGCFWVLGSLFAFVLVALVYGVVSRDRPPLGPTSATPSVSRQFAPPEDFRGVKWGAALPPKAKLRETVLHGCSKIVELKMVSDTVPCSHSHIDTDDIDDFGQTENVLPFFGVRVSSQLLTWSEKRFWSGHLFIYNYSDVELSALRAALAERYGPPHFTSQNTRTDQWVWRSQKIQIILLWDPFAKPSLDPKVPPATSSIQLIIGKFD
jgi:hypothetical protein